MLKAARQALLMPFFEPLTDPSMAQCPYPTEPDDTGAMYSASDKYCVDEEATWRPRVEALVPLPLDPSTCPNTASPRRALHFLFAHGLRNSAMAAPVRAGGRLVAFT
jgi:hypothetical protein